MRLKLLATAMVLILATTMGCAQSGAMYAGGNGDSYGDTAGGTIRFNNTITENHQLNVDHR